MVSATRASSRAEAVLGLKYTVRSMTIIAIRISTTQRFSQRLVPLFLDEHGHRHRSGLGLRSARCRTGPRSPWSWVHRASFILHPRSLPVDGLARHAIVPSGTVEMVAFTGQDSWLSRFASAGVSTSSGRQRCSSIMISIGMSTGKNRPDPGLNLRPRECQRRSPPRVVPPRLGAKPRDRHHRATSRVFARNPRPRDRRPGCVVDLEALQDRPAGLRAGDPSHRKSPSTSDCDPARPFPQVGSPTTQIRPAPSVSRRRGDGRRGPGTGLRFAGAMNAVPSRACPGTRGILPVLINSLATGDPDRLQVS